MIMKMQSMLYRFKNNAGVKVVRNKKNILVIVNGQHINLNLNTNYSMQTIGSSIHFKRHTTKTILKLTFDDEHQAQRIAKTINREMGSSIFYRFILKAIMTCVVIIFLILSVLSLLNILNSDSVAMLDNNTQQSGWVKDTAEIDRNYPDISDIEVDVMVDNENSLDKLLLPSTEKGNMLDQTIITKNGSNSLDSLLNSNVADNAQVAVDAVENDFNITGLNPEDMMQVLSDPVAREVFQNAMLLKDEYLKKQNLNTQSVSSDLTGFGLSSSSPQSCEPSLAFK